MSTLEKIRKQQFYSDLITALTESYIERITWIFCPGHVGNERADNLAENAAIEAIPIVFYIVKSDLNTSLLLMT